MLEESEVGLPDLCRRAHGLLVDARGDTGRPTPEPQMARLLTLSESTPRRPNDKLIGHLARFLDLLSPALHPYRRPLENDRVSGGHRGMTLTTIEAARGLQWKVVFVMDASEPRHARQPWARRRGEVGAAAAGVLRGNHPGGRPALLLLLPAERPGS